VATTPQFTPRDRPEALSIKLNRLASLVEGGGIGGGDVISTSIAERLGLLATKASLNSRANLFGDNVFNGKITARSFEVSGKGAVATAKDVSLLAIKASLNMRASLFGDNIFNGKIVARSFELLDGTVITGAGGGTAPGTVTSVQVNAANGVSGTVTSSTSTPVITLSLNAITPTTVTASGTVTGANLSGTNTGDQFTSLTPSRILGRASAGLGVAEELTGAQVTSLLDVYTPLLKGVIPASGGGADKFLRADGAWAAPATVSMFTAGETLGGHRALYIANDGKAYYADPTAPTSKLLAGITTGAATVGGAAAVQTEGVITEPSWNWTSAGSVWLAASGQLTQTVPTSGYLVQVGVPMGPTKLRIEPQLVAQLS